MKKYLKKIVHLTLMLLFSFSLFAQDLNYDYKKASSMEHSNYYEIVKQKRKEFDLIKKERKMTRSENKAYKHFERWAWFWGDRVNADGSLPSALEGWKNAGLLDINTTTVISMRDVNEESWTNIGPQTNPAPNGYPNPPKLGRLQAFWRYVDAGNASNNVLLVGAPTGGIWKSTNNGSTWSPKFDTYAGIGITDIKGSSSDINTAGVLYAATGDYDGSEVLNSIGVYKSTDKGDTWTATNLSFALSGAMLLGHLVVLDDNTVIVGTENSIKKTINGGNNWNDVYSGNGLKFGRMASSGVNIVCTDLWGGVHFSTNSGDSWTQLIAPGNNEAKVAVTADESGAFFIEKADGQIQQLDLGGGTVSDYGSPPSYGGANYDRQGGYNQTLVKRGSLVLSGSVNGFSSDDNAGTWYNSLNGYNASGSDPGVYVHSDHHQMGYLDAGLSFWDCHDGGLSFVTYSSASDQSPSATYKSEGVAVTQVYSISIDPTVASSDNFMMANQDNDGFSKEAGTWVSASAGDGVCSAIDYSTPGIRYLGGTGGNLTRSDQPNGYTGNYNGVSLPKPANAAFDWPLYLSTTTSTTLYGGYADLYKSTNKGDNWTNLNSGAGQIQDFDIQGTYIAVIGATALKKSSDDGASWSTMNQPSGQNLKSVSIDGASSNGNTIYATVKGYNAGSKVFKSTDGGSSWSNISGTMPNILMKKILFAQNQSTERLYVGTELGVYYSSDGGTTWNKLGDNLPNVIVTDLKLNYLASKLFIGTYGRGMWSIPITSPTLPIELISFDAKVNLNKTYLSWSTASEINNKGFKILRSVNGFDWQEIGFVEGKGNTNEIQKYEFIDKNPHIGINYYRLKQTDFNALSTFSDVKSITINSDKNLFALIPNPINSTAVLSIKMDEFTINTVFTIYTQLGQKVYQTIPKEESFEIFLSDLASGIYYVEMRSEQSIQVKKLKVQ